jgi:hypothetical protein
MNKKTASPVRKAVPVYRYLDPVGDYSSLRISSVTGMICFADTGMTKQRSWQNQNRSSFFLNCLQTIAYIILPFSFST